MREAAERVLFAETLEEKLATAPEHVTDALPGRAIATPPAPGRPAELRVRADGVRVDFPGTNRLDDERERGMLLHFLANHELLAAELMALVLLKFPDAPREYRAGVYEAMREEQMHARMYLRRMRECGIAFGDLPVNDYFWRIVAPMETPMDFVARLNLTFEQANLDFSRYYAGLFRQAGDAGTAAVLEKIYRDEIGHVGHGLRWFRKWKERGQSDWDAYRRALVFPLTPARAKGVAPFNAEGRRLAGLDEDFIGHLEVAAQSRGRTPVVHWFNPNAEGHARPGPYQPDQTAVALEEDLAMLAAVVARRDDVALVPRMPSREHLARLQAAGLELPEMITGVEELAGRKLGGMRPWAWSPDAVAKLRPLAPSVSSAVPWPWREPMPREWLSKEAGLRLEKLLGLPETAEACRDVTTAWEAVTRLSAQGKVLVKALFSRAGQGHRRIDPGEPETPARNWLRNTIAVHGGVTVEPWLERVADFSALYEVHPGGRPETVGLTVMENDAAGRYTGTVVGPKWGSLLSPEVAVFLHREARVMEWYLERIPAILPQLLPGYVGPAGVDAMVFRRQDGSLGLKHVVELNVRTTMGRVALELSARLGRSSPSRLRILKVQPGGSLPEDGMDCLPLNDPHQARRFIAVWDPMHSVPKKAPAAQ